MKTSKTKEERLADAWKKTDRAQTALRRLFADETIALDLETIRVIKQLEKALHAWQRLNVGVQPHDS